MMLVPRVRTHTHAHIAAHSTCTLPQVERLARIDTLSAEIAEIEARIKQLTDPSYDPAAIVKAAAAAANTSTIQDVDAQSSSLPSDTAESGAGADAVSSREAADGGDGECGDGAGVVCGAIADVSAAASVKSAEDGDDESSRGGSDGRAQEDQSAHDPGSAHTESVNDAAADANAMGGKGDESDDEDDKANDAMTMDQQLVTSVLLAIKDTLNAKTDLPLLVAVFYAKHVLPSSRRVCPGEAVARTRLTEKVHFAVKAGCYF